MVVQVWDLLAGDEEEHAITLYNFLYYLHDKKRAEKQRTEEDGPDSEALKKKNKRKTVFDKQAEGAVQYALYKPN